MDRELDYRERMRRGENYRRPPTKVNGGMVALVVGIALIVGFGAGVGIGLWFL